MATAYTSILKLALPVQGELSGTWGDVVNDNITSMVEEAIAGRAVINTWTTNSHTLTSADGTTSESRCAMLEFTDTGTALTGDATVVCPTAAKIYICKNDAGQKVTIKTSAGTGVAIADGQTMFVFCDGTNVVEAVTSMSSLKLGTAATSVQVTAVLDEDDLVSDSATALATQQSIKAYVDAQVTAQDLDFGGDSGTGSVDLDSQTFTIAGTANEIETSASGQTLTVGLPAAITVTTSVTTPLVQATNVNANDGSSAIAIADSTGQTTINDAVLTTADINAGTIDNTTIGGTTAAAGSFTTVDASGNITSSGQVITNTINEQTATSGVTVDGVLLKDGGATFTSNIDVTGEVQATSLDINGIARIDSTADTPLVVDGSATGPVYFQLVNNATAANNNGGVIEIRALSSTQERQVALIDAYFSDITDASRDSVLEFQTVTNGTSSNVAIFGPENIIFNEAGIARDFRVESDGNTHMLFVDASENAVAIGSASTSTASRLRASTSAVSSGNSIVLIDSANDANVAGNHLRISSARGDTSAYNLLTIDNVAGEILNISGNGSVVFNEAGGDRDFRIESDSRSNALVLDGGTGGLALNTTNSDFYTGFDTTSIKLGPVASMWSLSNGSSDRRMTIDQNLYVNTDGTNRYLTTGAAARYQMNTGTHRFETAPSGSDDATATSTVQMLIENGGEVRMLPSNTDAQNLKFRTTSTAGRSVIKALTREDSGSINPMSQLQLMAYGANSYLGQFKVVLNSTDTYNSTNQNNVADFKGTGGLVLNESGLSYLDFRVESDSNANMLFVDASANAVGIGTNLPREMLHVSPAGNGEAIIALGDRDQVLGGPHGLRFYHQSGSAGDSSYFHYRTGDNTLNIEDTAEAQHIKFYTLTGGATFNETGRNDADFRVESTSNANMLKVDAGENAVGIGVAPGSGYRTLTVSSGTEGAIHINGENAGLYIGTSYTGGFTNNAAIARARVAGYHIQSSQVGDLCIAPERQKDLIFGGAPGATGSNERYVRIASGGTFVGYRHAVFNEDSGDYDFRVESNNSDHMLFVDAGNDRIGVNNASPSSTVHIGRSGLSNTGLTIQSATTSALITLNGRMNNSGSTTTAIEFKDGSTATTEGSITVTSSGTTYNTTSDRRLKTDIQPIADATDKLMAMNPVTHKWIADPEADAVHGFIAQEMQEIVPEAVSGDPDGEEMMSMDYGRITPVLVAALQDAHNKITALEKRLAEMEAK